MKAVYFDSHGGIDVLRYGDLPDPTPGPGEVIVKIEAASLNFNDLWARQGMPGMSVPLPHVSGSEGAGRIVEVGQGVTRVKVDDEVVIHAVESCRVCPVCLSGEEVFCRQMKIWGFQTGPYLGAYCQYARVQAAQCLPKPKRLNWIEAASVTNSLMSVWRMLVTRGRTMPGEHVLIFGASGGTGSFAVQLVKALGGVAIAVTSSEVKEIFCRELGADHIIRTDRQDVVVEVKRITERRGVDVVFDHAGKHTWQQGIASLSWGGRLVIFGATEGFDAELDLRHLWNKQLSLLGSHAGTNREAVASLKLVEQGLIRPFITEVIALKDLPQAQVRMASRQTMGKIAVDMSTL